MEVSGIERVNARDAYVLEGYPQNDSPERLYFDIETVLLTRRLTTLPSSLGRFPYAVDYVDYKKQAKA